jgi:hypothetical protein
VDKPPHMPSVDPDRTLIIPAPKVARADVYLLRASATWLGVLAMEVTAGGRPFLKGSQTRGVLRLKH